jgi:glutamate-1-semialdehyde 2,1-aminomutase
MVDAMNPVLGYSLLAVLLAWTLLPRLWNRLALSKAKHPSLRGHSRMARWFAKLVPFYEYGEDTMFGSDGAPAAIAEQRRTGFMRLADLFRTRFARTVELTAEIEDGVSDLQFTAAYRVPFQYSRVVRKYLKAGSFVRASSGVTLTDLDGTLAYDLGGSYGVNVFG